MTGTDGPDPTERQPVVPAVHAGVGRVDITPPPDIPNGMWMAQTHVRAEGIHQALWLTALALSDGVEELIVLDIDWCLLSDDQVAATRRAVAEATGVRPGRILPACTHNHAGPVTQNHYRGEGAEEVRAYVAALPGWAAEAARRAWHAREPSRFSAGRGRSEIGVNRDLRLPDGRVVAGPNPDGPADTTVGVVRIERTDGTPLAVIVNYACHPTVLGPGNRLVSPDYPGSTKRTVESAVGAPCLFLQGAAGDMGPVEGFVPDAVVAERLGTLLGLEAAKVALSLDARPVRRRLAHVIASGAPLAVYEDVPTQEVPPRLVVRSGTARLPIRSPLPDVLSGAARRLAEWERVLAERHADGAPPEAVSEANQHVERERLRAIRSEAFSRATHAEAEVHVVAVGDVAMVFVWGEPYSQIGHQVKTRSPYAQTLFCGYVGGDPTYIATPEAYAHPQPFQLENCPFAPEAAETLVTAACDLLDASRRQADA